MIVRQSQIHHGTNLHLPVDGNGFVLDSMETQDGRLREVDDGCAHEGAKDASVGDGEGAAGHIFNGEFVVAGLK